MTSSREPDEMKVPQNTENIRTLSMILTAAGVTALVAMNSWVLVRLVDLGERTSVIEQRILGHEPPYNQFDAERDQGVLLRLIDSKGKTLEDHEGRLRMIERRHN